MGLWGLPDSIIESVLFHHQPGSSPEKEFGLITTVHVANVLVARQMPSYTVGKLSMIDYRHIENIGKTDRLEVWKKKCDEVIGRAKHD